MSHELVLSGGGLHLRFFPAADRHAHVVSLVTADRFCQILESVEGTASDSWPTSPALQSPHIETSMAGRRVALLVGMAGRSHWSLAAELVATPHVERLIFDVACRVSASPQHLGSRYRLGRAVQWNEETGALRTLLGVANLRGDDDVEVRTIRSSNEIEIVPRRLDRPLPATIRWKFWIEIPLASPLP